MVRKASVRSEVRSANAVSEREIIEAKAEAIKDVSKKKGIAERAW